MVIPEELKSWINDSLEKGYSVEELKEKLVKRMYDSKYVDSVFEEMKVPEKEAEIPLPEKPSSHSKRYWLIMVLVLIMLVLGAALIYLGLREYLGVSLFP